MQTRTKRLLLALALLVLGVLAGAGLYVKARLNASIAPIEGKRVLSTLEAPVEITFDSIGLPHIWAHNQSDAMRAIGWLHAAFRPFQTDLTRRVATGRLSELLGPTTLSMDKWQRRIGHTRLAAQWTDSLSDHARSMLEAYCDGVNQRIATARALPFEYWLLSAGFAPLTVEDVMATLSFQTWFSDALQNNDDFFKDLHERLTDEQISELVSSYPDYAPTTVKPRLGIDNELACQKDANPIRRAVARAVMACGPAAFGMTTASNAWVVAPGKSASGQATLASDPHLLLERLPAPWYYLSVHIRQTDTHASGVTMPGLPFIIMGHNRTAAWAFTVGGIDVTDYYREELHPESDSLCRAADGWDLLQREIHPIPVAGDTPHVYELWRSPRGPLIERDTTLRTAYSVHWAGYDLPLNKVMESGLQLASVGDFGSFRKIVTSLGALDAHWMYADSAGNIGYQLGTPIPVRTQRFTNGPLDGWNSEHRWRGFVPLEQTPHEANPERGWIASANNCPVHPDSMVLHGNFAADRIRRISRLLDSTDRLSAEDMNRIQMDLIDMGLFDWRDEAARLLLAVGDTTRSELVAAWDGHTGGENRVVALLTNFLYYLEAGIFEDELGELHHGIKRSWLQAVYADSASSFFDDTRTPDVVETREDIALAAMTKAASHTPDAPWSQLHVFRMDHPMAAVPVIGRLLDLSWGPVGWEGSPGSLNASFFRRVNDSSFVSLVGPSWRFVIDFAAVDSAAMVMPAGNSGNPVSPYYMNFQQDWIQGNMWTVPTSQQAVRARSASILHLVPSDSTAVWPDEDTAQSLGR
jgi:penicillin amidase